MEEKPLADRSPSPVRHCFGSVDLGGARWGMCALGACGGRVLVLLRGDGRGLIKAEGVKVGGSVAGRTGSRRGIVRSVRNSRPDG